MTVTIDTLSDPGAWQDAMRWLKPFLTAPVAVVNDGGRPNVAPVATLVVDGEVITVDRDDAEILSGYIRIGKSTYSRFVRAYVNGKTKRLARYLMGEPEGMVVDHINGNPLDNRRANLRICTVQENNWNRQRRIGGSSVFKGVSAIRDGWKATIWPNGKQIHLGSFAIQEDAARAYDAAAVEAYGDFACLNFPATKSRSAALASLHSTAVSQPE